MKRNTAQKQKPVRVTTRSLAYGGAAVGSVSGGEFDGLTCFVHGAVPGESGTANVTKKGKRFIEAAGFSADCFSSHRVKPFCPVYQHCGGCNLQHVSLDFQRELKREMVATMLERQGQIIPEEGVKLTTAPLPGLACRRRVTLHLSRKTKEAGFYRKQSHKLVAINNCPVTSKAIDDVLPVVNSLKDILSECFSKLTLEESGGNVIFVGTLLDNFNSDACEKFLSPELPFSLILIRNKDGAVIEACRAGEKISVAELPPYSHFSQVNAAANQVLIDEVVGAAATGRVTDLYAGSGNFSIPLAEAGCEVTAVELDPALVNYGKILASSLPVSFINSRCEEYIQSEKTAPVVVLDPPRTGAKEVCSSLHSPDTRKIIYVSCDLPTLVRDLRILTERGFRVIRTTVVDMFPHTHHVETITVLESANS